MVFKRKLLSSSVALAIAGYVAPLMAEEEMGTQNPAMEEVVVKGIRGSLQRSMDIKRDASGVVDAISAEEMGNFPETGEPIYLKVGRYGPYIQTGKKMKSLFPGMKEEDVTPEIAFAIISLPFGIFFRTY